ncbi:nuclear transport factor 2 family protein, partial [Streptomyces parvus]
MRQDTADVNAAIDAELQLLDPRVRGSRALAARLLDPEFVEVGASGRRWTYEEMLAALPDLDGGGSQGT